MPEEPAFDAVSTLTTIQALSKSDLHVVHTVQSTFEPENISVPSKWSEIDNLNLYLPSELWAALPWAISD